MNWIDWVLGTLGLLLILTLTFSTLYGFWAGAKTWLASRNGSSSGKG